MIVVEVVLRVSDFPNHNFIINMRAVLVISGSNNKGDNCNTDNNVVLVIIVCCGRD